MEDRTLQLELAQKVRLLGFLHGRRIVDSVRL